MYMADKNNDGLVSYNEWNTFYEIFVEPFVKECDKNLDLFLDKKELEGCFKSLPSFDKL